MGRKSAATMLAAFMGVAALAAAYAPPVMAAWPQSVPAQVTATEPSFNVENFTHPGAEIIGADRKIVLKDGNGYIQWVPCITGDETQIEIDHIIDTPSGEDYQTECFKTLSTPAWLKMEIVGSFGIDTGASDTIVTTVLDNQSKSLSVEAGCRSTVRGEDRRSTVVELKVNYTGTRQDTDCMAPAKVVTP